MVWYTSTDSVVKSPPMVAGLEKSSRDWMNTSRQPEMMPGRDRGKVTVQKVCQRLAPMLQAASSTDASMEERMPERVI